MANDPLETVVQNISSKLGAVGATASDKAQGICDELVKDQNAKAMLLKILGKSSLMSRILRHKILATILTLLLTHMLTVFFGFLPSVPTSATWVINTVKNVFGESNEIFVGKGGMLPILEGGVQSLKAELKKVDGDPKQSLQEAIGKLEEGIGKLKESPIKPKEVQDCLTAAETALQKAGMRKISDNLHSLLVAIVEGMKKEGFNPALESPPTK